MDQSTQDARDQAQPKRIRDLFSQPAFGSVYLATTLELLHFLTRLGLKPKEDGWRKYAAAFLRSEDSRFLLTVFRLNAAGAGEENAREPRPLIVTRLKRFFREHPQLWETRLAWTRTSARVQPNPHCDLVWAEFDARGNLAQIVPHFEGEEQPRDPNHLHAKIFVEAYNRTREIGRQRPYRLMKTVGELLKNDADAGLKFAERVLNGVFVRIEDAQPTSRFDLPDFSNHPHPGGGAFHVLCRRYADGEADLWLHVSHVLQDGKPALEALEDLKKEWGVRGATVLPRPIKEVPAPILPARCDSGREMAYVQQVVSFESLLETRKMLNEKFAAALNGNITLAGMLLWGMSQHPFLRDEKMTVVVDVPPDPPTRQPRTLGFVTTRPGDFQSDGDREGGFVRYQNYLNAAIERARRREDMPYAAMMGQALMPVESYEMTLKSTPGAVHDIGGKLTLTIIPAAEYVAANADDSRDALIAVGNVTLSTEAGGRGGVVSVKAVKENARQFAQAIFDAVTKWRL